MIDFVKISVQCLQSYPAWLEAKRKAEEHGVTDLVVNSVYDDGSGEMAFVPPMTLGGFIGDQIEMYYFIKKKENMETLSSKLKAGILAVLIGCTAFFMRWLGYCMSDDYQQDFMDESLWVCILFSFILWIGIVLAWEENE